MRYMILRLGHTMTASVRAVPSASPAMPKIHDCAKPAKPTLSQTYLDTKYAYIPVLAENDADGMNINFTYTYDKSTGFGIQTSASTVSSDTGVSPWTVTGSAMEATDRQFSKPWNQSDSYHSVVFVNYSFNKSSARVCNCGGCSTTYSWQIGSWTGAITDNDPDPACNGCDPVGVVPYQVPAYTTNPNYSTPLTSHSPTATRSTGQTYNYSFTFDFAGFASVTAQSSYGSITSVTWNLQSGCAAPKSPNLWGNGYPPASAPIEQADCFVQPT